MLPESFTKDTPSLLSIKIRKISPGNYVNGFVVFSNFFKTLKVSWVTNIRDGWVGGKDKRGGTVGGKRGVALIYPSIKWVLQIRLIFPGQITHTINSMHLTLNYVLMLYVHKYQYSDIDQTTQENRLNGDKS